MQPKSQFSSGRSAHKASALGAQYLRLKSSITLLRPCSLRVRSAQAIQPACLSSRSPALSLTSSTTLLRPCSPRVSSAQAIQPIRPQRPGAQQLSLKSSTNLLRPCSLGVSSAQAPSPRSPAAQFEGPDCSTQTLNSGYVAKKLIRFMQNSAKYTSRGENGEIKNICSLRKRPHMSWVPSPTQKKKKKKKRR